jgi:hypothetical protein
MRTPEGKNRDESPRHACIVTIIVVAVVSASAAWADADEDFVKQYSLDGHFSILTQESRKICKEIHSTFESAQRQHQEGVECLKLVDEECTNAAVGHL